MYNEYFHFDRSPFLNTADPGFYFNSRTHREALATMVYGIREGKGFTLITGGVGTGKTMLVEALRAELGEGHLFIDISSPWVSSDEIFASIWHEIGLPVPMLKELIALSRLSALKAMKERLVKLDEEGRRVVLIVDEAHHLPEQTLEGIRLFADMETYSRKLLQVILLGQEELRTALNGHSLRALRGRIALSHHLEALSAADTEEYICHRIRAAGGNSGMFSPACFPIIYAFTGGSPRAINYICDQCLLFAFGNSQYQIDVALLRKVIARSEGQAGSTSGAIPQEPGKPQSHSADAPIEDRNVLATKEKDTSVNSEAIAASDSGEFPTLPFQIPNSEHVERRSRAEKSTTSGFRLGQVVMTLAAGLLIGAIAVLIVAGKSLGIRLPVSVNFDSKPAESPKTGMAAPANESIMRAPAIADSRPMAETAITPRTTPLLPHLPLPSAPANAGKPKEVEVGPNAALAMLASQQYGAWNPTVRDVVAESNPTLENLEKIPDGARVTLPKLSREAMVVADDGKSFYIFYGSFESQEAANQDAQALNRLSTPALLIPADRSGAKIYRLYVGPYGNRVDANTVANSLWFKYLPGLN